jgi:hypothetical protein
MKASSRFMKVVVCIALGIVLGFVLYIGIARIYSAGYFVPWHKLPTLPAEVTELVIGSHGTVYARTPSGTTYRCSRWQNECWVQDEIPQDSTSFVDTVKPCDLSAPQFSWVANSPADIAICIQGEDSHIDCFGRDTYILDNSGDVWEWSHSFCVNALTLCVWPLVTIALGTGAGLVAGLFWASRSHRGKEFSHEHTNARYSSRTGR